MRVCRSLLFLCAASGTALAATGLPLHQAGPQPAHTGGFGEPTCHACHFDYPLNEEPRAAITLQLPESFESGQPYALQLRVQHPELKRGGFQLSARFADGTQAGSFAVADSTHVRVQRAQNIEYGSHTAISSAAVENGAISWRISWIAPAEAKPVVFHVAANVGNGDASEFGDRIFVASFEVGAR